ncbi:2-amino-4-hydroxy-6-hydroxymethyldihydropteridine diphosphokinase [Niallia sp. Krafla_26]|uniref:2-amino-4-hydroxy-6- hydroxymethyldihydropteridine diphosphokinase n=1 Tax=Niallia sp. Krafla_26 TaxID=3064703 RepID=UPI003D16FDE7
MNQAYISLGSNIGDRLSHLKRALELLQALYPIELVNSSSVFETNPVGYTNQDLFLNMVVKIKTELTPFGLLDACLEIEKKLGRKREIHWGPRTIDLDILLFNEENIITERLVIPHPRMFERSFVIIPLLEISPALKLSTMTKSLREVADELPDKEGVRIWKGKNGEDVFALSGN